MPREETAAAGPAGDGVIAAAVAAVEGAACGERVWGGNVTAAGGAAAAAPTGRSLLGSADVIYVAYSPTSAAAARLYGALSRRHGPRRWVRAADVDAEALEDAAGPPPRDPVAAWGADAIHPLRWLYGMVLTEMWAAVGAGGGRTLLFSLCVCSPIAATGDADGCGVGC
ncbi:hypothetical protein I4F81_006810 [Pyropia yezoensis]|uniref:Uncharacterized protein n=1 Tax=Pyropia yezoensis TaxID=2788 RepID=A0ACC3C3F0_PYRYE|nr:hypothetical protein I4F81_006810 [Neopyropia yezoensis]